MATTNNMASLIPRFNGEDYDYWSHQMKVLLKSLKLWNIVEDGYEEPDDEDRLTQQQKNALSDKREKDSKALFQIYQTIETLQKKRAIATKFFLRNFFRS